MKSYRHVQIQLSFNSKEPIYQQIKAYIINEIMRGRLLPGALLPGSRVLAQQLKVNRNTVILAYDQLTAAGWLTSQYKSGTRVSDSMPAGQKGPPGQEAPPKPSLHIPFRHVNISLSPSNPSGNYDIIFDDGRPDLSLIPVAEISRECRRLFQQENQRQIFSNNTERGNELLLQEVNTMLNNDRGLAVTTENICITHGMQMALYLTAQTLLLPGDHVAVEHPGYQPAWQAFKVAGAQLHYIPSGQYGINMDELEARCRITPLKALYITPHHQYPTTTTLSVEKRMQLLALSKQYNFVIIEDDYDHEYHFHTHHIPLAGMEHADNVIYIGSVMHTLPVSFVCGPAAFINSLSAYRSIVNHEGDPVLQQAIANLMAAGDIRRHIHNTRYVYMKRLELANSIVHSIFAGQAHYTRPQGGLAIWLQLHKEVEAEQLLRKVQSAGMNLVNPLSYYTPQYSSAPGLRLGYASLEEPMIIKGLGKLAKVIQQL
ncbi:PLP-dependent aminotransferase family protein [Chitinophaga sp. CF418]|uniref:MocR-like pyridoxine biosynthesis transcription factor PdxR n=1 Tax=Chitinophaga sp. CF418 TaxID=1855287 RepID=UPI00091E8C20|nr:PLP-dependent aminotransferase family protein [Chitinophaga sp. CF418]SHN45306.1 GntR family transcriptional regulator / MocR family aminotransferase [Chitinophaga sp. CF418]